jgi:putative endonuclease
VTTDLDRRLREHNEGKRGAAYTRCRRPVTIEAVWQAPNRSVAQSFEHLLKKLPHKYKERLAHGEKLDLNELLPRKK